ncbi:LysR family transcriptional regulator [Rhizorhabdus dicambivorans]|uniref:LysR family transcriptional regulator n=2 Tax=Rhizorhabdus dicambivorans TaxID=1850238 RepID=A0A2A4FNX6_9SPHN|nr:LysR family transcriptional regulator [Rhizorhabdus dicambivorans]PCE39799.1 LysR family transcriptional regulator [Rhizorhabdus dicambivorans]
MRVGLNMRHLEIFQQVTQHGGFNRAAAHLHIAQSALSRHVQQLEADLGVALFERSGRGVQLTPAGEILAQRVDSLLRQFRQTRDELVSKADIPQGELAIGLPPSMQGIATRLLAEYRKAHPDVAMTVKVSTSIELREWLLSGAVDVAIFGILEPETVLESYPFQRDQVYALGAAGSELTGQAIDMRAFAKLPLILTSRPNSMRLLVDHAAQRLNLSLDIVMDVNSIPLLIDLVGTGLGYTALPSSAVLQLQDDERFTCSPLKQMSYSWTISNSRERPLSAAGRRFRSMVLDLAGDRDIVHALPDRAIV